MDTFLSTLLTMSVTAALVAGIVMLLRLVLRPLPRWTQCKHFQRSEMGQRA